ncbi:LPS export ABC transporter periplasmic protein LptC [Nostoc ellipsosporum NOK]|jgi:LPS export ABC transporter protein LptC|nr:LPS export ABC transporter periplasmic protein LptC [Nostoc ellipsosporum NOK]
MFASSFIAVCWGLLSCENSQSEVDVWTKKRSLPEEARNMESYLSQNGLLKAKLTAPLMLRWSGDSLLTEFPNSLHVDFFDDSARIESKVDSKYGIYYENLAKVYLRDSVLVTSVKGDSLWCHDLWWDQNRKIFYSDTTAIYKAPGRDITGTKGIEATQDFSTVTFKYPLADIKNNEEGSILP